MIRLLIVDDSRSMQRLLASRVEAEDIQVVGFASDPFEARDQIAKLSPDVITLDLEMPRMDGLTFLQKIMVHHPLRVVVVSSIAAPQTRAAIHALELGAAEVMDKEAARKRGALTSAVRRASHVRVQRLLDSPSQSRSIARKIVGPVDTEIEFIALGASTGGPRALSTLFARLPNTLPPIALVQHMPEAFTEPFARRLDECGGIRVRQAKQGDVFVPGEALVAPGSHHLSVIRKGEKFVAQLSAGPPVNFHRPSVDVLFKSVAAATSKSVSAILTGMGNDGARGMLALRQTGGITFAQDEESSVVFGMPKEALSMGGAMAAVPLSRMATTLVRSLDRAARTG